MSKIKVAIKKNQIIAKGKLEKTEGINAREIQIFQSKLIRGLMRPVVEDGRCITYMAPMGIALEKFLKNGITKNDFFLVIAQTIEMIKKVERNKFDVNNIILNIQLVFINEMTKEVSFIYQPIINSKSTVNLFSFLYSVCETAVLSWRDDAIVIPKFVNYIKGMTYFSTLEIENYILREYPEVYKQIQRTKDGHSQVLNEKKWDAEQDTALLEEEQTALLCEEEEQTTLLYEEECEATTLLQPITVKKPYLIRVSTQERAEINKEVFLIGKEQRFVDFYINGNSAVSRKHAEIIVRDDCYFIKDNHSTNKTYVNDVVAAPETEMELKSGDKIVLANEAFEFYIEEM